jgi:hypothetical protein
MKKLFLMCALMFWASAVKAQVENPVVPLDDPAHNAINKLSQAGLIEAPPNGINFNIGPRGITRYEFAVAVARLWQNVQFDIEKRDAGRAVPQDPSLKVLQQRPEILDAFTQLAKEFAPELHTLGLDENLVQKQLSTLNATAATPTRHSPLQIAPPFPDVPKNHWAYFAVESPRKSGVLIGYPGGTFNPASK